MVFLCVSGEAGGSISFQKAKERPPVVERITENVYRIGSVIVDTQARKVTCPGVINMDRGAIEYLAVAPKGKLHESLLRVDARPLYLQTALLLAGLQPKNVLERQGDPKTPEGDPVEIWIRRRDAAGKTVEVRAEEWIMEMPGQKPMGARPWVFTGSRILKEGFQADLEQSLVAVWHDPAAIIDNRSSGGANNAYVVNTSRVPKRGTRVEFIVKAPAGATKSEAGKQP